MNENCIQTISRKGLLNDVTQISQWERLAGSEEEAEAFLYLEKRMKELGYITRLYKHDAFISIPLFSRFYIGSREIKSQTHSMSKDTGGVAVTGELIYIDDLASVPKGADYQSDIILTKGRAVYKTVNIAELTKASAVVFIQESPIRECIPSAAWGSPTPESRHFIPDIPVISIGEEDGRQILDQMKRERVTVSVETKLDTGWKKIPLLTGELRAPVESEQFVMFSGHVDSWYYGAIDNGTANAVQLETARQAAEYRTQLKRNFRVVFFSGHSQGRYAGSAWYADSAWEDLHRNCVVNINADSLGGKGASDITRSIIMPETKELAVRIIKERTGIDFLGSRCQRVADQSFWPSGVSSAFASFSKQVRLKKEDGTWGYEKGNADLGWWWHTKEDTIENVDLENLVRDAGIFSEYVLEFLLSPFLPLNYVETLKEIEAQLKQWQEKAGERVDLKDAIQSAGMLVFKCQAFYDAEISPEIKNNIILRLGRILVPLNYTTGSIYENDPALLFPPIPSLAVIDRLLCLNQGTDEYKAWMIIFMRKRNFVSDSLQRAYELLEYARVH